MSDLDEKSTDKLKEINDLEVKRREVANYNEKIPMLIVKVMIPNFSDKFRIIDIPGMTSPSLCDGFFNFLQKECLVNIFLIVRSLVHTKVSNVDFVIATNNMISKYPNSLSLLILTKIDEIIKENNPKDLKNNEKNLKSFLTDFGKKSNFLNYLGGYVVNCKEALNDTDIYKNGVIKLKNHIIDIEHKFAERQKMTCLILKLRYLFNELNSVISEQVNCLNSYEVLQLKKACDQSCNKFDDSIDNWFMDIKEYRFFKEKYEINIEKLKILFDEVDKRLLTSYYANKTSYIEDQIKYLGQTFQSNIIDSKIIEISSNSFETFTKEIPPSLSEKVKNLLIKKGFLSRSIDDDVVELSLKNFIFAVVGIVVSFGIRIGIRIGIGIGILALSGEAAAFGTIVVVPIIGEVALIGGIIYSIKDYIGVWKRENCFEDIIDILYKGLIGSKDELLTLYKNNYKEIFAKLLYILKTSKEDSKLNEDLKNIVDKYDQFKVENENQKVDVTFKNSLTNCIETLEVPNQDDLTKARDFMNKVVNDLI